MINLNDLWLRSQAAQHTVMTLVSYNAALAGRTTVQMMQFGMDAPLVFWGALGRRSGTGRAGSED